MVKAKKHLGQHFLHDKNIASKIVHSLSNFDLPTLEIGPGTGVLTQILLPLLEDKLFLIEIDTESVTFLKEQFPQLEDKLVEGDFLRFPLDKLMQGTFQIIGNFPYNISSQIFFKVLEHRDRIPEVVCMIQKEVAERLSSPPGNKTYGILSVLLQTYYQIDYLFTVSEQVFTPPPKVKSAVIRFSRNNRQSIPCDEKLFFSVVKASFGQRRKTLRNSLRSKFVDLQTENEIFNKRPEQLSVEDFIFLTGLVADQQK